MGVERRVGRVVELGGEESTDRDHYAFIRTDPFTDSRGGAIASRWK